MSETDNECERCGEETILGSETCLDCGQEILLAATGPFYYQCYGEGGNVTDIAIVATRFFDQHGHLSDEELTHISPELKRALDRIYVDHGLRIDENAESNLGLPPTPEYLVDRVLAEHTGMFIKKHMFG